MWVRTNFGGYRDPQEDALAFAAAGKSGGPVKKEAAYLTTQQAILFQPTPDVVVAWKSASQMAHISRSRGQAPASRRRRPCW